MSVPVFAVERQLALTYFFLGKDPNPDYLRQSWDRAATLPERRQSSCALKMQAGELPMRSAAKRSNIAPNAETNVKPSRRCLRSSGVTPRSTECRQFSS